MTPASAYGKETEMKQAITLIDLGDAKTETQAFGIWPICNDSWFVLAEYPG